MNKVVELVLANIVISETSLKHQLSLFIPTNNLDELITQTLKQNKIQKHIMLMKGLLEENFYTIPNSRMKHP